MYSPPEQLLHGPGMNDWPSGCRPRPNRECRTYSLHKITCGPQVPWVLLRTAPEGSSTGSQSAAHWWQAVAVAGAASHSVLRSELVCRPSQPAGSRPHCTQVMESKGPAHGLTLSSLSELLLTTEARVAGNAGH